MRRKATPKTTFDRWVDEQDWPDERLKMSAPPENWAELEDSLGLHIRGKRL